MGRGKPNKRTPFNSAITIVDYLASLDLQLPLYRPSIPFHNTPNPFKPDQKEPGLLGCQHCDVIQSLRGWGGAASLLMGSMTDWVLKANAPEN